MAAQVWDGCNNIFVVEDVDPTNPSNKTTRNVHIGWVHHYVDGGGTIHEYWQLIANPITGSLSWDGGQSGQSHRLLRFEWMARNSSFDGNSSAFSSACKAAYNNASMKLEVIAFTRQTV